MAYIAVAVAGWTSQFISRLFLLHSKSNWRIR